VLIAGVGNLGHALADYRGFAQRGFQVVALVDSASDKVAKKAGGITVEHIDDLAEIVRREDVAIGVICTPATAAQEVADRMVAAGIRSILNFAPAVITVPEDVSVRKVDLSIELQILAYYEQRKAVLEAVKGGRGAMDLAGVT
jgi:redox-sensing transcriptional repressor